MIGELPEKIGNSTYISSTKYTNIRELSVNNTSNKINTYLIEDNRANNYMLRIFPTDSKTEQKRIIDYSKIASFYLPSTYFVEQNSQEICILGGYFDTKKQLTKKNLNVLNLLERIQVTYGLLAAINTLHSQKIYHGNIKQENIFIQNIKNSCYPIITSIRYRNLDTYDKGAINDLKDIQQIVTSLFNTDDSNLKNMINSTNIDTDKLIEVVEKTLTTHINSSQINQRKFLLENQKNYQEFLLDTNKIKNTTDVFLHSFSDTKYCSDGLHEYEYYNMSQGSNLNGYDLKIKNKYYQLEYRLQKLFGLFYEGNKPCIITERYSNYKNFSLSNIPSQEKIELLIDFCDYINIMYENGITCTNIENTNLFLKLGQREKKILYHPIKSSETLHTTSIGTINKANIDKNITSIGKLLKCMINSDPDLLRQYSWVYKKCKDDYDDDDERHESFEELLNDLKTQYKKTYIQENEHEFFEVEGKKELFRKRKLMESGEGEVWKIEGMESNRIYALKEYSNTTSLDEKRIDREFRNMEKLKKADKDIHIVKPIETQKENGATKALVFMKYYSEGSLGNKIISGEYNNIEFINRVDIIEGLIKALKFMHDNKIMHRDIKPDNILLEKKNQKHEAYLCDFGNVKNNQNQSDHITSDRKTRKTIGYYPPELDYEVVSEDIPYSERSDIFSLGITFYAILKGTHCYFETNLHAIGQKETYKSLLRKKKLISVSEDEKTEIRCFNTMIEKMCKHDPAERYQNCAELLESFQISKKRYLSATGGRK